MVDLKTCKQHRPPARSGENSMRKTLAFLLMALTLTPVALAAGDKEAGKAKSQACAACHGADGNSLNPEWPSLAGQVSGYITKQLTDFKAGARVNPIMQGIVASLSPQDMSDLDAYFSDLPRKKGEAKGDKDLLALGEHLYRGGNAKTGVSACMSCHGPSGDGIPPRFPSVSGQLPGYTKKQLLDFKRGVRANDAEIMTRIAFRMSEQEIEAVSQYMFGLR